MLNQQIEMNGGEYHQCNNCGATYHYSIGHSCNVPNYIGEIRQRLIRIEELLTKKGN